MKPYKLPDCVSVWASYDHRDVVVLELNGEDRGLVSIDFKNRVYEFGGTAHVRANPDMASIYIGRGWVQHLVNDAVEALKAFIK